jgi:hypothetical protein
LRRRSCRRGACVQVGVDGEHLHRAVLWAFFVLRLGGCCIYMASGGLSHSIVWRFCISWACIGRNGICIGRRFVTEHLQQIAPQWHRIEFRHRTRLEHTITITTPQHSPRFLFPLPSPTPNSPLPNTPIPHLSHPCPGCPHTTYTNALRHARQKSVGPPVTSPGSSIPRHLRISPRWPPVNLDMLRTLRN